MSRPGMVARALHALHGRTLAGAVVMLTAVASVTRCDWYSPLSSCSRTSSGSEMTVDTLANVRNRVLGRFTSADELAHLVGRCEPQASWMARCEGPAGEFSSSTMELYKETMDGAQLSLREPVVTTWDELRCAFGEPATAVPSGWTLSYQFNSCATPLVEGGTVFLDVGAGSADPDGRRSGAHGDSVYVTAILIRRDH